MDVLTGERMKKVDEATIERFYPGLELMERAGRHVANFILSNYPAEKFKAAIFVGPGNNGGDALVVARLLAEEGRSCSVHYLTASDKFTPDAFKNYQRLQQRMDDRNLREINSTRPDWANIIRKDFLGTAVIVDGLFGTGLSRPLDLRAAEMVELINTSGRPVVSIDIPSGVNSDTGAIMGTAINATQTVTMGYPKLGMLFYPGKSRVGTLDVADLGFPDEVLQVHSQGMYLLNRTEAASRLPRRRPDVHKYSAGTVLCIAGSRDFSGAASLAAEAVLRSGAGMVFVAVPAGIRELVQATLREAIVVPLPQTDRGGIAPEAIAALGAYLERADAVALGPGLGSDPATGEFVRAFLPTLTTPLTVDADALNACASDRGVFAAAQAPVVATPHSGELARLLGGEIPAEPAQRIESTRQAARELGVTLVHKGAPTLIATPEGEVWVNEVGTSALATAGSGDVLTGLIAGMNAQGAGSLDAAAVACYLHGRAGVLAADTRSARGVIAGDLLNYVGPALKDLF